MSRTTRPFVWTDANFKDITDSSRWLEFRAEYSGTSPLYIGRARPGAAEGDSKWQVYKVTVDGSGNITAVKWPEGSSGLPSNDFEFSWTDRATYTYS